MAGFPSQSPFGFDPWQMKRARKAIEAELRAQKQQRRAQRDAVRAQRNLYRQQTRALRRSSILGPLLVVALGVVLLLLHSGKISAVPFAAWYGRWWPLLLVAAGLVLLAEWALDQIPRQKDVPRPNRSLGGGAVILLILLALTGAVSGHLHDQHADLLSGMNLVTPDSLEEFLGEKHESSQTLSAPALAGTQLEVSNPHGDITISGTSSDEQVHVTVAKQVYSSSDSDAEQKAQELSPSLSQTGSILTLNVPTLSGATADLTITVPATMQTTVTANHGDVSMEKLQAPVALTANHGDVKLEQVAANVTAHVNHRDSSVSVSAISGNIDIVGHAEDINVSEVSGRTSLEGEYYGDIHLEHLHGPVIFKTSRTQLAFGKLEGYLDISPKSELNASQISGPSTLTTRSRNITLTRVAGDLRVSNADGSIDVIAAMPVGSLDLEDRDGEVNVTVPEHADYSVDAQTRGGEIESDFNLDTNTANKLATATGTIGTAKLSAPRLEIHTTHLNIGLHRASDEPVIPSTAEGRPQAR
jgi:DUF4097 and DUF4098 domain-containing protein YvlB